MKENVKNLATLVEDMGFSAEIISQLTPYEQENHPPAWLKQRIEYGGDVVNYALNVKWHKEENEYSISSIRAALRKELIIPDKVIAGLSTTDLEGRMAAIDWKTKDYLDTQLAGKRLDDPEERIAQIRALGIINDLQHIRFQSRVEGALIAIQLELKYLAGTPNEKWVSLDAAREKLEISHVFDRETLLYADALEIYNLLDGRAVERSLPHRNKPDILMPGYMTLVPADSGKQSLHWIPGPSDHALSMQYLGTQLLQAKTDLKSGMELFDSLHKGNEAETNIYENGVPVKKALIWFDPIMEELRTRDPQNAPAFTPDRLNEFIRQTEQMGFEGYGKYVRRSAQSGLDSFELKKKVHDQTGKLFHTLSVRYNAQLKSYEGISLTSILLSEIRLPEENVNGIDVQMLDRRMRRIPWQEKDFWQWGSSYSSPYDTNETFLQGKADRVLRDMDTLLDIDEPKSRWVGEALFMKHLRGTPNEYFITDFSSLSARYEIKCAFDLTEYPDLSLTKAGNLLEGRAVFSKSADGENKWIQVGFRGKEYVPEIQAMTRDIDWGNLSKRLEQNSFFKYLPGIWTAEQFNIVMKTRFEDGELIKGSFELDGKIQFVGLQANPASGSLSIVPLDATGLDIFYKLQLQTGLELYTGITSPVVGQIRDYDLHPVPVADMGLESVLQDLELFGFGASLPAQVRLGVQIGYPSFSIPMHGADGSLKAEVMLYFELDAAGYYDFDRFNLSLKDESGASIAEQTFFAYHGYNDSEYFGYDEACNLLQGRFVCHSSHGGNEPLDEWYYLDLTGRMAGGNHEIKACFVDFDLEETLQGLLLYNLQDPETKDTLLLSLRKGEIVQVSGTGAAGPQVLFISANPLKGGFRLHEDQALAKERTLSARDKDRPVDQDPPVSKRKRPGRQ